MSKIKIGAITIGQAPRTDMTKDMADALSENITLVEFGALDDYSLEAVQRQFAPKHGDTVLVSRMKDGTQVKLSEQAILPLIQDCIDKAQRAGVSAILLLCTGAFPEFTSDRLLLKPQPIFHSLSSKLAGTKRVGLIVPDKAQEEQVRRRWQASGIDVTIAIASPYKELDEVLAAAEELKTEDLAFICLDCMGFTVEMKKKVSEITGKPVILPRTLMARIIDELYAT